MSNIKHKDVEIPKGKEEDPFENCQLNRKQYADILTNIIDVYSDGFVLAVNNEWGTGKTTFIKMWQQQLNKNRFKTLYFNAWETDFEEDVLISMLSVLKEFEDVDTEKNFRQVATAAVPLAKKVLPILTKKLVDNYIGEGTTNEVLDSLTNVTVDGILKRVEKQSKKKQGIEAFKKALMTYVNAFSGNNPLVFFIDELDRCRPNYSVQVLEQIKHLFSVPGIVFVLSIDKNQLSAALKGVYGSNELDANTYLKKFIDLEYSIPSPSMKDWVTYLLEYYGFEKLFDLEIKRWNPNVLKEEYAETFKSYAVLLFEALKITLRSADQILSRFRTIVGLWGQQGYPFFPSVALFLYACREYDYEFYHKIQEFNITCQEIVNFHDKLFPTIRDGDDDNRRPIALVSGTLLTLYQNSKRGYKYRDRDEIKSPMTHFNYSTNLIEDQIISLKQAFDLTIPRLEPFLNAIDIDIKIN
ncbi:KAP family P-loop NTPase fold protein [Reichenbachiella versicolor]|uniref:KAP family P-loop NTPase fold protein n=1 Tax=Reichenbachiella versicolor TaxID=1821036 RepID=UPI000D6DED47|nr:P-loop NTPase fold protein [Reichenbachiella versicolor]